MSENPSGHLIDQGELSLRIPKNGKGVPINERMAKLKLLLEWEKFDQTDLKIIEAEINLMRDALEKRKAQMKERAKVFKSEKGWE